MDSTITGTTAPITAIGRLSGAWHVFGVSLRRMVFSRQSLVSLSLLAFALLAALAWASRRDRTPLDFVNQIVLPLYISFLLPMFCLCYGTASIASEREDRTLVYLLITPLPRPLVFLAKYLATLTLTLAWTIGGLALLGKVAGAVGWQGFLRHWPTAFWATLAYIGLFQLLSVVFRRATIVGLAYALVVETFLGNMPGIVKRVAITFYAHCHLFDAAADIGMEPAGGRNPALYLPVDGPTGWLVLCVSSAAFFLLGLLFFSRYEYA